MNKFNKFVIVSHVALFSIILELYRCSNEVEEIDDIDRNFFGGLVFFIIQNITSP